jgi:hypothetical protein
MLNVILSYGSSFWSYFCYICNRPSQFHFRCHRNTDMMTMMMMMMIIMILKTAIMIICRRVITHRELKLDKFGNVRKHNTSWMFCLLLPTNFKFITFFLEEP